MSMDLSEVKRYDTDSHEYDMAHRELAHNEQKAPCTCMHKAKRRLGYRDHFPSIIEWQDADPDCELHFPWRIEDDMSRMHAMRWWMAGYQVGYATGCKTGRDISYEELGYTDVPADDD
jgi:hypothetical protein